MGCFGPGQTEQQKEERKQQKHNNKEIERQLKKDKLAFRATHRLLLLGNIFKRLSRCFVESKGGPWFGLSNGVHISSLFSLRGRRIGQEYNR